MAEGNNPQIKVPFTDEQRDFLMDYLFNKYMEDMMNDEHYIARGMFQEVEANGRTLHIPAMLPILTETPGSTEWPGPELSEHTEEVLTELLGKDEGEITQLREDGVV